MKPIAALLCLTLLPALATAQDDPDLEVYQPVATTAPKPAGVALYDADWTADRKIAMAFVERYQKADKLIIATYDPIGGPGAFVKLGEIMAPPWRITDISLAVPEHSYGDPAFDRIFVATSIQAPVFGATAGYEVVNSVRLFWVAMDPKSAKLQLSTPRNMLDMAVLKGTETPHAQVTVLPDQKDYMVEMAFIDPRKYPCYHANPAQCTNGQSSGAAYVPLNGIDAQVMVTRSFDQGTSLDDAFFATGDNAANGAVLAATMGSSQYGRLSLASDEEGRVTVLAVEDPAGQVVHVLTGDPTKKSLDYYATTPTGDSRPEFSPRIASDDSRFTMTCLAGSKTQKHKELLHFTGTIGAGSAMLEYPPLSTRAATEGDVDVRGMKAWIIAGCYPDNSGAPVPTVFEEQRNDPFQMFPQVEVLDMGVAAGTPRVGVSPDDTPKRGSYFFGRDGGSLPEGVWMDP